MYTLRDIEKGDPVTVAYRGARDGPYFNEKCKCSTCDPESPPHQRKRPANDEDLSGKERVTEALEVGNKKKKTRRGGRRAPSKRKEGGVSDKTI